MIDHCIENLEQIRYLLNIISNKSYTHPSVWLSQATIGQHIRHILEFYECVISGHYKGVVNYDLRERKICVEHDPQEAKNLTDVIIRQLDEVDQEKSLVLEGNFSTDVQHPTEKIKTTVIRELAYCLEHSIHHQALIKVALLETGESNMIEAQFGVAPATIRFQSTSTNTQE